MDPLDKARGLARIVLVLVLVLEYDGLMVSVREAERLIAASVPDFGTQASALKEAEGRILREDVRADRDYPPYDRATMDGIAISHAAWARGRRSFQIEYTLQAGRAPRKLKDRRNGCVQIMTGAVLPPGADCVVPVEQLDIVGKTARVDGDAQPGQFIHRRGSDRKKGALLIRKGCRLNGPQVAVIASTGRTSLRVACVPSVAVISTGDELVEVGRPVKSFQIRPSNAYGIRASLRGCGLAAVGVFRVRDDRGKIRALFAKLLREFDVLVVTGGVSMGKYDFVPGVLRELGVRPQFHKVLQKPGKPFWFGLSRKKQPVFALPGNPVSTMVCLHRYVLPSLVRAMGLRPEPVVPATLSRSHALHAHLTLFLPVREEWRDNRFEVAPGRYGGSGDLAALSESDGFIELPPRRHAYSKKTQARYRAWS